MIINKGSTPKEYWNMANTTINPNATTAKKPRQSYSINVQQADNGWVIRIGDTILVVPEDANLGDQIHAAIVAERMNPTQNLVRDDQEDPYRRLYEAVINTRPAQAYLPGLGSVTSATTTAYLQPGQALGITK